MTTALLISPAADRKQLQQLAPTPISEVYEAGRTGIRDLLRRIERHATMGRLEYLVIQNLGVGVGTRTIVRLLRVLGDVEVRVISAEQEWLTLEDGQSSLLRYLDEALSEERRVSVRLGVERSRRQGRRPGRPKAVIPDTVFALAAQGLSLRAIAREVGLGASTVQRALAARRVLQPYPEVSGGRRIGNE